MEAKKRGALPKSPMQIRKKETLVGESTMESEYLDTDGQSETEYDLDA